MLWHHQCTGCSRWDTFAGRCGGDPRRLGQLDISGKNGTVSTVHYDARKLLDILLAIVAQYAESSAVRLASLLMAQFRSCYPRTSAYMYDNNSKAQNLTRNSVRYLHTLLSLGLCRDHAYIRTVLYLCPEKMSHGVLVLFTVLKWLSRKVHCRDGLR